MKRPITKLRIHSFETQILAAHYLYECRLHSAKPNIKVALPNAADNHTDDNDVGFLTILTPKFYALSEVFG